MRYLKYVMLGLLFFALSCAMVEYKVKYTVTADGTSTAYAIAYVSDANGSVSSSSNVSLPWEYTFDAKKGSVLEVAASANGTVHVKIYVNGVLKAHADGDGYAAASFVIP